MKTQRSALLGLVLGLAVFGAACEDKTEVVIPPEPDPPIVVTVTPQQLALEVGQTATLAAAVTGGNATTAKTVTWSSSSAAVASVDASGNVTANAAGVATIIATSTADAGAKAAAAVTVTAPPTPAIPSVSIKSITQFATTIPVALNNVFGQIDITLNLDVPTGAKISALRTHIVGPNGSRQVCEQTFSGGAEVGATEELNEAAEIICSVNTAIYEGTPGTDAQATVWFANGPGYNVRVEIIDPSGTTTAEITSADLIFNNPSYIVAVKTAPTNCMTGATVGTPPASLWCEGDIVALFLPVNFSTNANDAVNSITLFAEQDDVAPAFDATGKDNAAPWSITLQKGTPTNASRINDFEGMTRLIVSSTTTGGQNGPTCINPDPVLNPIGFCQFNRWVEGTGGVPTGHFLVDNVGPSVPGAISLPVPSNNWIGPNVSVSSLAAGLTATDGGVGSITNLLQYRQAGTSSYTDAPNGTVDIPESTTNTFYNIRISVCDKLDNCTSSGSSTVGSDQTSPVNIGYSAPADGAILQTSTVPAVLTVWQLTGADALSGPYDTYGTLKRLNANNSITCVFGSGSSCNPVSDGQLGFSTTPSGNGFYTFEAVFRDLARNDAAPSPTSRMAVSDDEDPKVQNIVLPSTLPSGGTAAFSAVITDNLDLKDWKHHTIYANATELPYAAPTAFDGFGPPLIQSQNVSTTVNFIRSIEDPGAATANPNSYGASGILSAAVGARFSARDQALNGSTASNNFAAGTVPAGASATTLGLYDFSADVKASSPTSICDPGLTCPLPSPKPTSTLVELVARGMSGSFAAPFTRVDLFYVDVGGVYHFWGTTTTRSSTDTGVVGDVDGRVWTYGSISLSGAGLAGVGAANFVLVGVSAAGDALISVPFSVTIAN